MAYIPFPPSTATQIVSVSKSGNDTSGDGSPNNPFATIPGALTHITDASPTKRYAISVGPGSFNENFALKANVEVCGVNPMLTRIGGAVTLNDPSWTPAGNHQSGFQNVSFVGTAPVFDFTLNGGSNEGKIFLWNCRCNGTPTFTAFSNINQGTIHNSFFFAGYTQNGMNLTWVGCGFINAGAITLNSVAVGNIPTIATFFGGGSDGSLAMNWTAGTGSNQIVVQMLGFGWLNTSSASISGAQATLIATADSIPPTVNLSNSAPSPTLTTLGPAIGYVPGTPANWVAPVPTTVQQALDRLAAKVAALNGGPIP